MLTKGEIGRLLNRMLEGQMEQYSAVGEWAPSMDVSETKDSLVDPSGSAKPPRQLRL
jgi:hypothetical protein